MKVVINSRHGGFGLSDEAQTLYKERKGITDTNWYYWDISRDDPVLVELVEKLGDKAGHQYANLKVVDIPDDVDWYIEEYDGLEWVAEKHRTWE